MEIYGKGASPNIHHNYYVYNKLAISVAEERFSRGYGAPPPCKESALFFNV